MTDEQEHVGNPNPRPDALRQMATKWLARYRLAKHDEGAEDTLEATLIGELQAHL